MANTSNFREAIRKAQTQSLVGPNVIPKALPFVGGGLILTALGTYGGMGVAQRYPQLFMPTFFGALVLQLVLFFVAQGAAQAEENTKALPLLAVYSLLTGYTLTGLISVALAVPGVGFWGIGMAALGCGVTFIAARQIGSNLSETDGLALAKTVQLGIIGLVVVMVGQLLLSLFGVHQATYLELAVSALGALIFAGAAVVDFYTLPRTYNDEQYLSAALSMFLTYVNLFVFILRFLIALNSSND
ncbi:MAG: hypothetical protein HC824_13795 [Synechococcales cyanobacterium RM1_1_8]|nr:hypothetical protein [Synechococcales cyanobacterium RM1_1_8]